MFVDGCLVLCIAILMRRLRQIENDVYNLRKAVKRYEQR